MEYLDRIARSKEQVTRDLEAFVTESATEPTLTDLPLQGLTHFPEERVIPVAVAVPRATEGRKFPMVRLLAAAVLGGIISATWWGGFLPYGRTAANTLSSGAITTPPVNRPSDATDRSPAEVVASIEVRSPARPPIAAVRPTVALDTERLASAAPNPVALAGAEPARRLPPDRSASTIRGTSGAERPASQSIPPPRPPGPSPAIEMPRASSTVAANAAVRSPAPEPPPQFVTSEPAPSLPTAMPPAVAARPVPEALPAVVARSEQSEIQRALGQYRNAYQSLDAAAARAVWPTVDVRALARAFDTLTSQQLAFESCQFNIAGEAATAECRGSATYTPKVGNRDPKLEARQWTFHLRKVDDDWKIQSAQTRR